MRAFTDFIFRNVGFLLFGFLLSFFSSFGQTYFISLSAGEVRAHFGLSHGDFGSIYSLATLTSAAVLIWSGKLIDRFDLRLYSGIVCLGLAIACFAMSVTGSPITLFAAFFMLRHFGQGLMGHTSTTTMARYFRAERGKAIAIASLGYPVGEAIFPSLAVAIATAIGWPVTWQVAAGLMIFAVLPATQYLLRGHGERHRAHNAGMATSGGGTQTGNAHLSTLPDRSWTRAEVLRDPRCYLALPVVLAPSFIITGILFHQVHLAVVKHWSLEWLAASFIAYGLGSVPAGLVSGVVVDKTGAIRILPWFTIPLALATFLLSLSDNPLMAWIFMGMAGFNSGLTGTIVGAYWAEAYGVGHIGSIRAMATSLMVLSSAASPFSVGFLLDAGISFDSITMGMSAYILLTCALAGIASRRYLSDAMAHRPPNP